MTKWKKARPKEHAVHLLVRTVATSRGTETTIKAIVSDILERALQYAMDWLRGEV